jgi:hypothetical protein
MFGRQGWTWCTDVLLLLRMLTRATVTFATALAAEAVAAACTAASPRDVYKYIYIDACVDVK